MFKRAETILAKIEAAANQVSGRKNSLSKRMKADAPAALTILITAADVANDKLDPLILKAAGKIIRNLQAT